MPPNIDLPPDWDFDQLLEGPPLCPPFPPPPQHGGYPSPGASSWGLEEARWDDGVRPGHA